MQAEDAQLRRRLFPLGDDRWSGSGGEPAHFLVTSFGHSGSIWLAGSLNLHEAVCATVGIDNPIETFQYYPLNRDAAYVATHAGVTLSRHGFSAWDSARMAAIRALPALRGVVPSARAHARIPWFLFDELDLIPAVTPPRVRGNVHGLTLSGLLTTAAADPGIFAGRRVLVVDLIRHPVGRTESAINATVTHHLTTLQPHIESYLHEHAQECRALERHYGIDFAEPRARAALHVFRQGLQNDVWAYELRTYPDTHRILLERLQEDRDYYGQLFSTLAQGRLVADDAYLDRVFAAENLSSGRQTPGAAGRPAAPREQYQRWSRFEQEEFGRVAQRLDLARLCFPYGYDLSFVARGAGQPSWFSDMVMSPDAIG
jgi:hypothetical protein